MADTLCRYSIIYWDFT